MTTSFTDPAISMDLLRAVLQPSINEEIQTVFNKYMKFFQKAALNVRDNVGEEVDAEQLIQEACRSCLEQVAKNHQHTCPPPIHSSAYLFGFSPYLFTGTPHIRVTSSFHIANPCGPCCPQLSHWHSSRVAGKQKRNVPIEEAPFLKSVAGKQKRNVPIEEAPFLKRWKPKSCEPIRREGPKWDPARLNESTTFVLGSRANKALGMGGTRGRIYIKHPHLFKYAADPQDKHWLAEQHHMRATGGKMAYLLIEEDIRDLAASDDYRGCLDLKLEELKSFVLPSWMVEKMRKYMETLRTENEHRTVEAPPQT
ncbi:Deoxynucleotidyltransferase terminal-interacting protein 1 [Tupaia chinensis]|uniref:Deoxynucleotidyltransferase terminal-interacting protein 1 n=1 Tax=Tupaia chinensis TaxID=246437 RepID=L9KKI8_TUPCH|nr:Deoxynucleotidyltransferase terminal-interacting protein 1 [Tupaia chinensis]